MIAARRTFFIGFPEPLCYNDQVSSPGRPGTAAGTRPAGEEERQIMDIVVLCGGMSHERDVSITSGSCVAAALRERGHRVLLLDSYLGCTEEYEDPRELFARPRERECFQVGEQAPDLEELRALRHQDNDSILGDNVLEICRCADITFLALHGEEGENGKLQAVLDVAGIRYTGSGYLGSALAMNKTLSKELFAQNGILTPQGITLYRDKDCSPYRDVGFPCVVKPCSGGSSVGTSIVRSREEYEKAVELAFRYESAVIVERYIHGREFTVGILEDQAMPVIEIIPKDGFYDYKNKYQPGLTQEICPAEISPELTAEIQRLGLAAHKALMIGVYSRVDFLQDEQDGKLYCLEANTLPGMTPTSLIPQMAAARGQSFGELCEEIIAASLAKYEEGKA